MTVKELREVLSKYDDDLEVLIVHDAWCSVGSIEEGMISLEKREDWSEDGWKSNFGEEVDKVLVFDEDAIDDDEEDDEWEWSKWKS